MKIVFQILILVLLSLNCRAAIVPILRNAFTTNTFDKDIVGGAILYFDYPSGKFVATPIAYSSGITFDPTLGFLSVFHTNYTGEILLNLAEGGSAGPSIQAYSDRLVVANTNLSFDAVGPFILQWRVDGSNVLQSAAGGVSLSGKTNVVGDSGSAPTYNGNALGLLQAIYYGGQFGFGASGIMPTNIRSGNLSSGTSDIFTVPAGKRFVIGTQAQLGTTNQISTAAYMLLKTNGVYYRYGANGTVLTNATVGIGFAGGDNFLFEAGETIALNTTQVGVNAIVSGLLLSTNAPVYSARLMTLSAGENTLYTCPAGKCAVTMPFPHPLAPGSPQLFGTYVNDSGGSRVISAHIVPSGGSPDSSNIQYTRTVLDKATAPIGNGILFPGDSITISSDATTATQWVRITVVEIPFP